MNAYRSLGIFNENVVNRVLGDLVRALQPRRMAVRGAFTPRGGIQTTVEARFPRAAGGGRRGRGGRLGCHFAAGFAAALPGRVVPSFRSRR